MTKNKALLLIFPKRGRLIFIFSIIVVFFFTIVSKKAFSFPFSFPPSENKAAAILDQDTIRMLTDGNFESGNLLEWKQARDWEVSSTDKISGTYSLKHIAKPVSGNSSLFHSLKADWNSFDLQWSMRIKNGTWDPSASNCFWFYLSADTIQTELVNGWAVGVNIESNNDLLELWRIRDGKPDSMIIQSDLDWDASTLATIAVRRSSKGLWELTYRKAGESISPVFRGTDRSIASFRNIGLCFKYTYTRSGQLWVDDINVNAFQAGLSIQKVTVVNSNTLSLTFNKPVNPSSIGHRNFQLADENNMQIPILEINAVNGSNQMVELQLGHVSGVELTLQVSGLTDLTGQSMNPETSTFYFNFNPESGAVLINEVLFNPLTGGADFVELVNASQVPLNVHHLKLAARDDTMALKQIYPVCSADRYLKPGHFLTCTKDSMSLVQFYLSNDPQTFSLMTSFPSYPDDAGAVVLLNDSLTIIDELNYTAKMHSPFLASVNGVSLERISLGNPTADPNNWASAASSAGYATPGLANSQAVTNTEVKEDIVPEPVVFSPNGDGVNDLLTIRFNLSKPGYMANIRIYDIAGRTVKFLVKNESLSQQGSWAWKGDSDTGHRLNLGVYIILVELFDPQGHSKIFKKTCTLSDRMH